MPETWRALERECAQCRECALCQTRHSVVFGTGNPQAEVLLVGEAPGANEDEQGIPFVGRAGKFLDDMLAIIGLDRTKVYIMCIFCSTASAATVWRSFSPGSSGRSIRCENVFCSCRSARSTSTASTSQRR